jgi:hypothetical protein
MNHATGAPVCTPAYGRDYKSAAQARADWHAGKDFILHSPGSPWDGKLINKSQADAAGYPVMLRYRGLTRTCSTEE